MSTPTEHSPLVKETANDRFKKGFGSWFWGSLAGAAVLHFALFAFFPQLSAEDFSFSSHELEAIDLPPEIEIPPPPEQIARPATPVVAEADLDEDITIAPTTFEDNPIDRLPPPPTDAAVGGDGPAFTPFDTHPRRLNEAEIQRALQRLYPAMLRDNGIGGTVNVWFYIDETGRVLDTRVAQGSGHELLDRAALQVADIFRFSPALNREQPVAVWVQFPITFRSR